MNAKEKIVPQRRFKKFKNGDDWEQRKLCNIVTNISDGDWIESEHIFNDGEYRIIQTGNLGEGIYLDKTNSAKFFYQKDFNQLNANEIFPGDILISRLAEPAGRTIILPNTGKRMVTSVDVTVIRPDDQNFDSMFLMTQMNSSKVLNEVNKSVSGTTHKRISRKNLEQIDLYVPHLAEQTVIGAFFKQIDNIIVLQKNKLDKLKELKLAYLSEMFPAEGELKPKRRFAGFTDDWEQRKVRELFTVTRGQVLAATKTKDKETDEFIYPVYSSQTKNNGLMGFYNQYLFENAITWTTDGANAGTVNFRKGKFYSTNVNGVLLSDKGYANKAISEIINKIAWKHVSKVGNPKLMNNIMSEITIMIPSIEELNKISILFNQIDNTIALHQHKLEKLKNIKQAYLNELFV